MRRLREVLPSAFPKDWQPGLKRGRLLLFWREVVGSPLDQMTEAVRLEEGTLFVAVPDPVLLHHLTYMREAFLQKIDEKFPGMVREIRFALGSRPKPPPPPSPAPPPSEKEKAQAKALAQGPPPGLREAAERAALALLLGRKGTPCPICETPSLRHPCATCQRLLKDPLVEREARRLAQGKPPRLEGEAHLVALYLAKERLRSQLLDLLPQATKTRDESLRPLLADLAERYAALAGWEKVPEGVRTFLSR
ncbi:MAG: DUF721 domain-containing protein [Thermaceae bacterium]